MLRFKVILYLILLAVSQSYAQDNLYKWINESKTRYSSADHSKSLGLRLTIDYPKSWSMEEGKRPHIVKKFTGVYNETQNASFLIQIMPLDNNSDREAIIQAINNPINFKNSLPSGTNFINAEKVKIDGLNGAFFSYTMNRKNDLLTVYMKSKSYNFVYKNWWIIILYTASGTSEDEAVSFYQKANPLFTLISNSLVVMNQYEK